MTFRCMVRGWDEFLFRPVSPIPIATYRMAFGAIVLASALCLLPEVDSFFGPRGITPPALAVHILGPGRPSALAWLPQSERAVYVFLAVYLVAAACLTVGLLTRLSAVVVYIFMVSLHHRNPLVLNSSDAFMRAASFCLMFSAAGKALSVDRWLRVRRGLEPPGEPAPAPPWAQRLIQIQLAVVYLATVYWKLHWHTWVDGTAVYYATRVREYDRFPVPYLFDHLWTIKLLTWGTLVIEFALGALVWFRDLRYPVLLAGVMLHLGLEYSMNIQLFQWVMLSAFVLFIDPRDFRRRVRPSVDSTAPSAAAGTAT
jgi:hypothetical protein